MRTITFIIATALATLCGLTLSVSSRKEALVAAASFNPGAGREESCRPDVQADVPDEAETVQQVWFVGCGGIY